MSSEQRRQQLMDVALQVVTERGFAGLTLREVAARAAVAHSLVRHHFGTRDQLLIDTFEAAAADDSPALISKGRGLRALASMCEPPPTRHYLTWIDAWSEAPRSEALHQTLVRHHTACQNFVAEALDDAVEHGVIPHEAPGARDIRHAAINIIALFDGLAVQHYVLHTLDEQTHRRLRRQLVAKVVGIPTATLPRSRPRHCDLR